MLKYIDLYDYILGVLYSLKRKNENGFFSLSEIVSNLDYPATDNEIIDIGKYLEAEGFVKAEFQLGDVFLEITPRGIIHIETKEAQFLPDFEAFIEKKKLEKKFEHIASKMTKKSIDKSRKPIIERVNQVISYLNEQKAYKHSDGHSDAKILKLELQKIQPDREVLMIKLENLFRYPEIKNVVQELRNYLAHYSDNW